MRTIQTHIFSFSELSDSAKQNAILNYRVSNDSFELYSEHVIEDAADIADILGIDLRQTLKTRMDKSTFYAPTVFFSGFSSQGDGACFEGNYRYKKSALKTIVAYAPADTELHRIAKDLQDLQRKNFYGLTAKMKHSGHYYHACCMQCNIDTMRDLPVSNDTEKELTQLMRDFANWIYASLESEFDYQNADDQIIESIEANSYEFLENGVISWN